MIRRLTWLILSVALLSACGGGSNADDISGGSGLSTPVIYATNEHPISVTFGINQTANTLVTSVTVCRPGSTRLCQTIDNILVDTGSTGLRIMESVLSPSLGLTDVTDNQGRRVGECVSFADGTGIWGPLRLADVYLGNQKASAIPIHTLGTNTLPNVPGDCSGPLSNTPESFGVNGVLGISPNTNDCGAACELNSLNGQYFACPSSGNCFGTTVAASTQLQQPIKAFSAHNNGSLISLPAVPITGAVSASGKLILGIGTASNNTLGAALVLPVAYDAGAGLLAFTTRYKNVDYAAFIDSGSNGLFIPDGDLPLCLNSPSFFCPSTIQTLSAVNSSPGISPGTVTFNVVSAESFNAQRAARPGLAGPEVLGAVDYGVPFFYGRNVFTAIEGKSTPGGNGPYFAY